MIIKRYSISDKETMNKLINAAETLGFQFALKRVVKPLYAGEVLSRSCANLFDPMQVYEFTLIEEEKKNDTV